MTRKDRLLAGARNNPRGVRFADLLSLVEALGFKFLRQDGSHRQYRHPTAATAYLNLQPDKNGMAKPKQVRQLLAMVARHGLDPKEDDA